MKPFYDLTYQGRVRRLRTLALKALDQYDLNVRQVRLIGNYFNCTFRIDTVEKQTVVMRIGIGGQMAHSRRQIRSEMMWLAALARDTDLAVPHPIPARNGDLVVTAQAEGVPEPRYVVIYSWLKGVDIAQRINREMMSKLGEMAARLHAHSQTWTPPDGFAPYVFESAFPFDEPVVLFEDRFAHLFPPERRRVFRSAVDRVDRAVEQLKAAAPMQAIHNDMHQWNLKIYRGRLSVFDFEDLMLGWPVQDVGTTFFYFLDRDDFAALTAAYREGYASQAAWPESRPGQVDAFIMARALMLCNSVLVDPDALAGIDGAKYVERTEQRLLKFLKD